MKSPSTGAVSGARADGAAHAGLSGTKAGGKTAVDLSAAARQLSGLQHGENDVNLARVQEIRDALASGQLKIDPSRIADGLLASVRDLLK